MTSPSPSPDPPSEAGPDKPPKQATLLEVMSAVFWSFFGVRKGKAMQKDAITIKPLQVVIVGVLSGVAFVLFLLVLVRIILSQAR